MQAPEAEAVLDRVARQDGDNGTAWPTIGRKSPRRSRADASLIRAAVERDLRRARLVQQRLIPDNVAVPGLDVAVSLEPCRWLGGDYADVVPTCDERAFLAVADVSGKGLPAALVISGIHSMVHACLAGGCALAELVSGLNVYLCRYLPEGAFVTFGCVAIDARTGETESVSAGHPRPVVLGRDGGLRTLKAGGTIPLGIAPMKVETRRDRIGVGEMLAMFTDGLTELVSESGRMLGLAGLTDGLRSACGSASGASACEVAARVKAGLSRFRGNALPHDDCTLMLAYRTA